MPDDNDTATPRPSRSVLTKDRMEALSDGVMGFAMTLLVVDLALRPPGSPLHQFLAAWPAYLAYLVSFLTIGSAWVAHNALTDDLDRVDRIFLRLNLVFLMVVVSPVPHTPHGRCVGRKRRSRTGGHCHVRTLAFGDSLAVLCPFGLHARRASGHTGPADADMEEMNKKFRVVVAGYVGTILLGLFFPSAAIAVYLAIAIFLFVPFRAVIHALSGGSGN